MKAIVSIKSAEPKVFSFKEAQEKGGLYIHPYETSYYILMVPLYYIDDSEVSRTMFNINKITGELSTCLVNNDGAGWDDFKFTEVLDAEITIKV